MKKMKFILLIFTCVLSINCFAQNENNYLFEQVIDSISKTNKGYLNKVQLNVSNLELSELLNSLALENNLNIIVDPKINQTITYNFFDIEVKQVLIYLVTNFDIEYSFSGEILSLNKRIVKPEKKPEKITLNNAPKVSYNAENNFISIDLKGDSLFQICEEITKKSGVNFMLNPEIRNKQIFCFIQNRPIENVIELLCSSNSLTNKKDKDIYMLDQLNSTTKLKNENSFTIENNIRENIKIEKNNIGNYNVYSNNADINDVLLLALNKINARYISYSSIEGKINLALENTTITELLNTIFNGTKYGYFKENDIYFFGENKHETIRKTTVIKIVNRSIEVVKSIIPKELISELELIEFIELNSLIVSGSERKIEELKRFIHEIDVVVPMVQIDVMLLYTNKSSQIETGLKAGLKDKPTSTSGTYYPGMDITAGSSTINQILKTLSGFGLVNFGAVTENFYISLKALETNSIISIESTPKISTLNGHEASISIGEKTYYQESQVNFQNTINNTGVLTSKIWKPVEANLTVKIKPFVSADEYVTLTVAVNQDDFSGKTDQTSPPNESNQKFESMVRIKNGEVILLGGLEKKKNSNSGSGVPLLSKIPILKWIFSSRTKDKENSKLHLLIKTTVSY
jgi:type IV pilus assembly protein PilQ